MKQRYGWLPVFFLLTCFSCIQNPPAAVSTTQSISPQIPDDLRVDGPMLLHVKAKGVQIYTCVAVPSAEPKWAIKGPEAEFVADDGTKGRHFIGPSWQVDGGAKIVGQKLREHASPDADAVPWLLLKVKSHEGDGALANATFVQRINTSGGKPPAVGDHKPDDEVRVPYTAEYIFYGPGATTRP